MEYVDVKRKVNELLMKKKAVLTLLVALSLLWVYGVQIWSPLLVTGNSSIDFAMSFAFSLLNVLISNIVFFCVLKHTRKERFGMNEVRFWVRHLPMQIFMAAVYMLFRLALDTLLRIFGMILLFMYLPLTLCLTILYFSAECTIAFCIYDNGVNVMEILRGVLLFIQARWRVLLRSGFPYLLSNFAYALCLTLVIKDSLQMTNNMLDITRTVEYLISDPMSGTLLSIIGLTFVFWIVFAYFELCIFMTTAVVYEEDRPLYFSRIKTK